MRTKKEQPLIIAVDFDGTLCTDAYPKIGIPVWKTINYCKRQKEMGAIIILWTCREGEKLEEAVGWCKFLGLEFDYVNEPAEIHQKQFGNTYTRKIYADQYIDDKALNIKDISMQFSVF